MVILDFLWSAGLPWFFSPASHWVEAYVMRVPIITRLCQLRIFHRYMRTFKSFDINLRPAELASF
jgi:hypothetical protein